MSEIPPLTSNGSSDNGSSDNGSSNNGSSPEPPQRPQRRRLWKVLLGIGLGLGSIVTVGGVVFYIWGDRIVTNLLLPRVAQTLDESIQRPVELGDVESFTFWGVKLGETVIPPTETDASSVTVDGIEITIGLRSLIFQRTIKSNVVLIRPKVSLIENENGQWLELNLPEPSEAERPVELEIESIEVVNASLSAQPYIEEDSEAVVPREPVQIENTDALVEFFGESAQEATFELEGEVVATDPTGVTENEKELGSFAVDGAANLETQTLKANARLINLPSVGANLLLPDSLGIRTGELDGNLTVAADFDEGELDQSALDVKGTAQFANGAFVVAALEPPIENVRAELVFSGQQVSIEASSLQLSETVLLAEGDVSVAAGYDLTAQIPSVSIADVQAIADVELPVAAAGAFTLITEVTGELARPEVRGRLASLDPVIIDQVSLDTLVADFSTTLPDFELAGFNLDELRAELTTGGLVVANGRADLSDLEQITFELAGNANVPTDAIAQTYGLTLPPDIVLGTLRADFEAGGDLQSQTISADWQLTEGTVAASGQARATDLQQLAFQLSGQANISADTVAQAYGAALPAELALGTLRADFEAGGDLQSQTISADWQLAEGTVAASGQARATDLQQLAFQLSGQANIPADTVAQAYGAALPAELVLGTLSADFNAAGDLDAQRAFADWQLSEGSVFGSGSVSLIDRIVALENARLRADEGSAIAEAVLNLNTQDWSASAATDQIALGQFTTLASGLLSADVVAAGNLDALVGGLDLAQIEASGSAVVANAQVQLSETSAPLLEPGDWRTAFEWQGDRLAVNTFSAPGLQADGTIGVDFSRDIPIGELALNVALQSYDLQRLNGFIPPSVRQYAQIDGFTSFDGQLLGSLENPQLIGSARLIELAVNDLLFEPLSGPIDFALADGGRVDLTGAQDRLQLVATDAPQREIPFWPLSFEVRNQDLIARGTTEGDLLRAEVVQLPLGRLNLVPAAEYGFGAVEGLLAANVNVNLADFSNPTAAGALSVVDPGLSPIEAEQLNARFTYANGTATLDQGELLFDESRYLLTGSANILGEIDYQGELTIAQGRIEDLIPIVQALDLSAFGVGTESAVATGSAADLVTQPARLPANVSFLAKLESFVDFLEAHPDAAAIAQGDPPEERPLAGTDLPPLEDLEGGFTGTITAAGRSLSLADATAAFDIRGDSWEWGDTTPPNEFALQGEVARSQIDIDTAFVNAGQTEIDLTASGSLDRLSGELVVDDLPVAIAELFYPLPADIAGDLDLTTTFAGSLANPTIEGDAAIANPQVNGYLLSGIDAGFSYRNAVLALDSTIAVSEAARPISVEGSVPYALPLVEVSPPERLALTAVVPNGNLELINALTNEQVQWQSGQGEVVVDVGGTLSVPTVVGRASFRNAAISSSLLADDITNVNGSVLFDLEQIDVQQLQAEIDGGRALINGRLPLLLSGQSVLTQLSPFTLDALSALPTGIPTGLSTAQDAGALMVVLEELPVDYNDLLQAEFTGQLLITGAALSPTVSGEVAIDNGRINATNALQEADSLLASESDPDGDSDDGDIETINPYRADFLGIDPLELEAAAPQSAFDQILSRVALRNLSLRLSDRLTIAARPIFRVTALGDLVVSGTLADIQPSGTIELQSGEVNLFASQFRLDRGAPNTATFLPENGLDPILDVELLARVQETDIDPLPPPAGGFANAEVNAAAVDTAGDVQFISVRAIAQGPASDITDNLMLTSRPPREEGELLALLGGSTVTGLATASLTQLGGFLGSGGALSTFGDRVADAIGLQSFRVFPTTDTAEDSSVGIGIGVEASAAIGDRFNITALEILNSTNPPQFGVLYRFTDELNIRGASNLDDTDFEIEYRIDF